MKKFHLPLLLICAFSFFAFGNAYAADLCNTSTNACNTYTYIDSDGTIWCRLSSGTTTCTTTNQLTGGSTNGYVVSRYCQNGAGVSGGTECKPITCIQGGYSTTLSGGAGCANYKCGPGYTGIANGTNNQGCTACTNKPSNATYTTDNSCDWKCNSLYYKSGSTCASCPYSNTNGVYTNSQLTAGRPGTTSGTDATSISDCYLPSGTYYAATGTFKIASNSKCQY